MFQKGFRGSNPLRGSVHTKGYRLVNFFVVMKKSGMQDGETTQIIRQMILRAGKLTLKLIEECLMSSRKWIITEFQYTDEIWGSQEALSYIPVCTAQSRALN